MVGSASGEIFMNRIYLQALPPHWIHQAVKLRPSWGSKFGPRVPGCLLCEVDWSVPSCIREAVVSASSLSPGLPRVRIQVEGSTGLSVPAPQSAFSQWALEVETLLCTGAGHSGKSLPSCPWKFSEHFRGHPIPPTWCRALAKSQRDS